MAMTYSSLKTDIQTWAENTGTDFTNQLDTFIDNTFDSATAFFTMMYIPLADHKKIFQEIYRVLKSNGKFFLWDLIIPNRKSNEKYIYLVYLKVKISEISELKRQ